MPSEINDRRSAVQRRGELCRETIYRTRREWIIGEFILGVVSCGAGLAGISGGLVSDTLRLTGNNTPWFLFFFASGAAFIVLSFAESRCRHRFCGRDVLIRYAYVRFTTHVVNLFCWAMAFLWLHFSDLNAASIYYEALPLAAANFWAMTEHAKALWLNPAQARTTSLVVAGVKYMRGG